LQPLTDLLLETAIHIRGGRRVRFHVNSKTEDLKVLRTLRFLNDNRFFEAIANLPSAGLVSVIDGDSAEAPSGVARLLGGILLPPKLLDYDTLIPCTVIDTSKFESRAEVFKECTTLK